MASIMVTKTLKAGYQREVHGLKNHHIPNLWHGGCFVPSAQVHYYVNVH